MTADDLQQMTLAERLKKADYLSRELSEHLRQASIPKLTTLIRASREYDSAVVSDQQMLDHTQGVLEAHEFSERLYKELRMYLDSIRDEMQPLLFPPESPSGSGLAVAPNFDPEDAVE